MPRTVNGLNLLVVEDSLGDARLVKETLKDTDFAKHEITHIRELDALKTFKRTQFQAILLDLHLSDLKPEDTFRRVHRLFPDTPIIVLTGLKDDRLAAKIVRQGAQDYLVKDSYDAEILQRALKYSIYRKKAEHKLAQQKYASQKLKTRADTFESESIRLAKTNDAKDVFLSIASHQLRTPATAVKQYIGMVLNGYAGEIDDNIRGFLETAYRSNERQIKIVDDLLKVAKLDAGQVTVRPTATDVVQLLRDVIADHAYTLATRKQKIEFLSEEPSIIQEIDGDNMRMVFDNLLDNACKYSDVETTIKISITKRTTETVVAIEDSGIGISAEEQKKLFQKFSRVDNSFAYAPNGSGLGLYWAKEIVNLHHGEIRVNSIKGEGSTFEVALPG